MNSPTLSDHSANGTWDEDVTKDAFFDGTFYLLQPAGRGFRAGHDALLLASAVCAETKGRALDMGSGAGAVALAAAARASTLEIVMAERNGDMAGLARRTLDLPENVAFAGRLSLAVVDLLATRPTRESAGLADESFDLVLTNPPFHPPGQRRSPDALRDEARAVPDADFLKRWIVVATALLRNGGTFLMIGRPDNLSGILSAAANRMGSLKILPIHSSSDEPASRILLSAVKGSRQSLAILPSIVLDAALREEVARGRHVFSQLTSR